MALTCCVPDLDIPDLAIALDPLDWLVGPWHKTTVKANRLRQLVVVIARHLLSCLAANLSSQ